MAMTCRQINPFGPTSFVRTLILAGPALPIGMVTKLLAPSQNIFVVFVREEVLEPGISGTIERWSWVTEDPSLSKAPIEWREWHNGKLWSRNL